MGRLLLITRPELQTGFQLAGVQAFAAENGAETGTLIRRWLHAGETGLLAIDEVLFVQLDEDTRQEMDGAEELPYLALPCGETAAAAVSAEYFVAEMIRRTIGFQLTFTGEG